jgi:hypothetical protein
VTAYLSECGPDFVTINSDSTEDRRTRANRINARRRWFEQSTGVKLIRLGDASYSETYGFLSRTSLRYRVYRGRHRSESITSGPTVYTGRH